MIREMLRIKADIALCALFVSLFFAHIATAGLHVDVYAWNKSSTPTSVISGLVNANFSTITTRPLNTTTPRNPGMFVYWTMDVYDIDYGYDDAVGLDASGMVNRDNWTWFRSRNNGFMIIDTWMNLTQINSVTNFATDWESDPDPGVGVTGGNGWVSASGEFAAPNVPPPGVGDRGTFEEASNVEPLFGHPITAFSRGYDEISALGDIGVGTAALYFSSYDMADNDSLPVHVKGGGLCVIDPQGQPWIEDAYATSQLDARLSYLNINSGGSLSTAPTDELYYVEYSSFSISYSNDGMLSSTEYADIQGGVPVTAIAVEDNGTRGLFEPGDKILYALESDSSIYLLEYGQEPVVLSAYGITFNQPFELDFSYLDDSATPITPVLITETITSLSVASYQGMQDSPADRIPAYFDVVPWIFLETDYDYDNDVDEVDLIYWHDSFGEIDTNFCPSGDADYDGDTDGNDFLIWQEQYGTSAAFLNSGTVPEPMSLNLCVLTLLSLIISFYQNHKMSESIAI